MFLKEFIDEQSVSDAVVFHDKLNPLIWQNDQMKPDVRYKLMQIALEFIKFVDVKQLRLKDIMVTGSNASYNYTKYSDIDLHIVTEIGDDEVLKQLYDAKKGLWNEQHDIKIKGFDVELYVQDANEPHVSSGMYSILNNLWIKHPKPITPKINDISVEKKYEQYHNNIQDAIKNKDINKLKKIKDDIKKMRQGGLKTAGEFSAENLTFKMLRNLGDMEKLMTAISLIRDTELSLKDNIQKE